MKRLAICIAAVVAALSAFASTASATTVTSDSGTTPTIHAESEGAITIHGPVDITCTSSTFEGKVESHGSGVTAKGNVGKLTFTSCGTNHVAVLSPGSLEIHGTSTTGNGTVTSTGVEISVLVTTLGITCVYSTPKATHIGTLTGAPSGGKATLHIDDALIPRTGGSVFCGPSGEWTGSYRITSPLGLQVH